MSVAIGQQKNCSGKSLRGFLCRALASWIPPEELKTHWPANCTVSSDQQVPWFLFYFLVKQKFNNVSWRKWCFENTKDDLIFSPALWLVIQRIGLVPHHTSSVSLQPHALIKLFLHPLLYQNLYSLKWDWVWSTLQQKGYMCRSCIALYKLIFCTDSVGLFCLHMSG